MVPLYSFLSGELPRTDTRGYRTMASKLSQRDIRAAVKPHTFRVAFFPRSIAFGCNSAADREAVKTWVAENLRLEVESEWYVNRAWNVTFKR